MSIYYIGLFKLGESEYHYSQCSDCGNLYPHIGPYAMCNGKPIFKCDCIESTAKLPLYDEVGITPEEPHIMGLTFEPTYYGYWRFNLESDSWYFQEYR